MLSLYHLCMEFIALRELGTTALVDAAGVHPSVAKVSLSSDTAEAYDILVPGAMLD